MASAVTDQFVHPCCDLMKPVLMCTGCCRYLGQLLDAEDAISSIRKGVDVLQQHVSTLVRLLHCTVTTYPEGAVSEIHAESGAQHQCQTELCPLHQCLRDNQ